MPDRPGSPRRRHILSSINPEPDPPRYRHGKSSDGADDLLRRSASPERETVDRQQDDQQASEHRQDDEYSSSRARRQRLHLKDHRSSRRHKRDHGSQDARDDKKHTTGRRHRHRQQRRRHRSATPPNPHEPPPLDPEAAFRESLFDAMADDEGAAYWEGVYGQPVHTYSNEKVGATGTLERMTDEEYATYVRQKMWEKTHAGLLEERERREAEKKRKAAEERKASRLRVEMEESLRRGEQRRHRKYWATRWDTYTSAWSNWDGNAPSIAWPVESGKANDVVDSEGAVRKFYLCAADGQDWSESATAAVLKEERVRWHPDRIQQRLGRQFDDDVMKSVTAIFQVVDKLWSELRGKN